MRRCWERSIQTLTGVHNLAEGLRNQGKYEAEEMHRRALEGKQRVLGMEHPESLTTVYCLAYLLHAPKKTIQQCVGHLSEIHSRLWKNSWVPSSDHPCVL